jgi:hypothetical protein
MKLRMNLLLLALTTLMLSAIAPRIHAQDNGSGGEPIVSTIDPSTLTYDYLVDGNLPADDPTNKKFKTLQAAYAAAPAGTITRQTVIGIMPNVYQITGTATTPGLTISKNFITLLGITNNRRSVVLADNRGNQAGAGSATTGNDGYVIVVNATGFTAQNLTFLNYCNVDYEYPGDSSKNLSKRTPVETQAVAIQTSGDRHSFINVAFLSRLDTTFIGSTRGYFSNVYIEGTSDFIGGGTVSYWENSTVAFPPGFEPTSSVSGTVFVNTQFVSNRGLEFYKGYGSPAVLINCIVPVSTKQAPIAWVDTGYQAAPVMPNLYSFTYNLRDTNGNPTVLMDSSTGFDHPTFNIGRTLTDQAALAYNPWNILRATPTGVADNWDPAGAQAKYDALNQGNLIYRMSISGGTGTDIRTGGAGATAGASVSPIRAPDTSIHWSTTSPLVTLSNTVGASITVTANNHTNLAQYVPVNATAADGYFGTAWFFVEPTYIDPPVPTATPTIHAPANGSVTVTYPLSLGPLQDQSIVSWFTCDDAQGTNPRPVAVSRGNVPLNTYPLTLGDIGRFLEASIQPKSNISNPGPAIVVIATKPVLVTDVTTTVVSPNFRNFPTNPESAFISGLWTLTGTWTAPTSLTLPNGYGFRVGTQGAYYVYQQDQQFGDMEEDFILTPEKTAGQGFGSPGSGMDGDMIQKSDIFIKYDPRTKNGYSLRFWRTTQSAEEVEFQFYKIQNGVGSPVSAQQQLTGVLKPDTFITVKMIGNTLTATGRNTVDQDVLNLTETVPTNSFGGGGVYFSGTVPAGNSFIYGQIQLSYPGTTTLVTTAKLFTQSGGGYQASVTVTNTGTGTAQNVQLSTATLGTASGVVAPISLGNILAGQSTSFVVNFPASAGADGAGVVEKFNGTYTGGTFGGSFRAVLP